MIDKLLLNNELLANKKKIRQVKLIVINKLVQKLRKIKNIMEKISNEDKLRRKIDKTEKVLTFAKKINCMDLLKKALLNEKNPSAILTNGNCEPNEIAEALLLGHKSTLHVTNHIRNLFHLNDTDNPDWKRVFVDTRKSKQDKYKNKKESKMKKPLSKKTEGCLVQEINISEACRNVDSKKSLNNSGGKNEISIKKEKQNNQEKRQTQTLDSFFVTTSGVNYLSSVDNTKSNFEACESRKSHNNQSIWNGRGQNLGKQRNIDFYNKNTARNSFRKKRKFDSVNENGLLLKNMSQSGSKSNKSSFNAEQLHPSWEAKQKLKPVITEFKGKKIVFDDN